MADDPVDPPDEALISYVRGRLPEAEAARVSGLAAERPDLAARIALAAALAADVDRQAAGPTPGELGWGRIARTLDAEARPRRASRSLLGLAAAAIVAAAVLVQFTGLMQDRTAPGYGPVSERGTRAPVITVAFRPDVPEADMRDLLRSIGADVVGGPSALGLWRLGFADVSARDTALARLEADPRVESAQME